MITGTFTPLNHAMVTPDKSSAVGDGCHVNFISWNVKGLNHPIKCSKVLAHLLHLKADIAFLQETHLKKLSQSRLRRSWVGQVFHSNFNAKARGTAILVNKNTPLITSDTIADPNGRFIIVIGSLFNVPLVLACVYAPNWDDQNFFRKFLHSLPQINTHHLLLGGDINTVLDPVMDRSSNKQSSTSKSAQTLQSYLNTYGVVDIWRFLNPSTKHYSFFSPVHQTYSRIDYFFIDKKSVPNVTSCKYESIVISDHSPLILELCFPNVPNVYTWRLNPLLLSDAVFVKYITEQINIFLESNITPEVSYSTIWESLKAFLRGQIMSFCSHKKKQKQGRITELTGLISQLDHQHSVAPSPDLYKERLVLQTEFNLITTQQAERMIQKSRGRWYEHGEKSSKLLAHQLRKSETTQLISEIKTQNGLVSTNPKDINETFQSFYSTLYQSESLQSQPLFNNFFANLTMPTLKPEFKDQLEEQISVEEIKLSIVAMQSGKSPGPDGYPVEFFKVFKDSLAPLLRYMYIESFGVSLLPPTLRQANISLLLKPNKNPLECTSYRPISLLNVDFKILSKLLALRLDRLLPSLISLDQTGFVKGRHGFFNLRRFFNILYIQSNTTPEVALSLDAEKAFDRVEWDYLFFTLDRFGFGPKFISWVRLLYSSPMARVRTNSTYSSYFPLHRGTRQGCPLSPLLFALSIEPLAIKLRTDNNIRGVCRAGEVHKLSLYADDLLLYLSDPLNSLPHAITIFDSFGKISGYKLNMHKSELLRINLKAKNISFTDFQFKVKSDYLTYLGIKVTQDFKLLYKENFLELLEKTKTDLQRWNNLPLSLIGRVNSIKMNVLPKFLYLFQSIPLYLPKKFFLLLDKILSQYIWNGKPSRIRKEFMQSQRSSGGLGLPNFQNYYWAANLRNLLYWSADITPSWVQIEEDASGKTSLPALLTTALPLEIYHYKSNPLLYDSLRILVQCRKKFGLHVMSSKAPIYLNHMFPPSSDSAFNIWSSKGLQSLKDLFIDGIFASFSQLSQLFNIPKTHFFRYLQIRHFIKSNYPSFPNIPTPSALDEILDVNTHKKGGIRKIYNILSGLQPPSLDTVKSHWEIDLGIDITGDLWETILRRVHSSSICARHGLLQFKVVHRLHFSKERLAKFYPGTDPLCNRCRHDTGSLIHTFWSCPNITNYWTLMFHTLSEAYDVKIAPNPLTALFGVLPPGHTCPKYISRVVAFASLMARRLILGRWKDASSPTHSQWMTDLMQCLHLEKMRCTLAGSIEKFEKTWQPFLRYIETLKLVCLPQ